MSLFGPTENDVRRAHFDGYHEGTADALQTIIDGLAQQGFVLVEPGLRPPHFADELLTKILRRWRDLQSEVSSAEASGLGWRDEYERLKIRLNAVQVEDLQQRIKALQAELREAQAGRAAAEAALQREKADRAREVQALQAEFNRQNKLLVEREAQWQQQQ